MPLAPLVIEEISANARIKSILESLFRNRATGSLQPSKGPSLSISAEALGSGRGELLFRVDDSPGPPPYQLRLSGYSSIFHFEAPAGNWLDQTLAIPLPTRLVRLRTRRQRRRPAPQDARIAFEPGQWPSQPLRLELHELSPLGLSFWLPSQLDERPAPGTRFAAALEVPGHPPAPLAGEIRSLALVRGRPLCGATFCDGDEEQMLMLRALLLPTLHPRVRTAGEMAEQVWDLYHRSGFFHLSGQTPERFAKLRSRFVHAARRLDTAPQLGFNAVRPSARGVEASLSQLKFYSGSWLGHQLAKLESSPDIGEARLILREIYLGTYERLQFHPDVRWLLGYCKSDIRWMQRAHIEFVERHQQTGLACSFPFWLTECATEPGAAPNPDVGVATAGQTAQLLEAIARARPWAYVEALDFVPDRFALAPVRREWGDAGFRRERETLVLRRDGQALAAAVLESTDAWVNLFHLLDSVRLFSLVDDADVVTLFAPLLQAARSWYYARGKSTFTCIWEEPKLEPATRLGLSNLGEGRLFVLSSDLLPDWLEHVWEITAPRQQESWADA
jgi:hypothetical protein